MLEWAAAAGEICLKYLDESGFNLWANVTYSWSRRGEQKRIEQTKKKGKRLNSHLAPRKVDMRNDG